MFNTLTPLELANLIHTLETFGEGSDYSASEQWLDSLTGAIDKPVYNQQVRYFLWSVCYWLHSPTDTAVATMKRAIGKLEETDQIWVSDYAVNVIVNLFGQDLANDYTNVLTQLGVIQ